MDTLEIIDGPNGKLLATPLLTDENKESGNRCFWSGVGEGWLFTDRCDTGNPYHEWGFIPVNGNANRFQLLHLYTGKCALPSSNTIDSYVHTLPCTSETNMIWSWSDGS